MNRSLLLFFALAACGEGKLLQTPPDGSVEGGITWWDDVQPIVEAKCQQCHSNPTKLAAVGPLVTYQDTQAPSSQGVPMHMMMAHRIRDDRRPMPPPSQSGLTAEEYIAANGIDVNPGDFVFAFVGTPLALALAWFAALTMKRPVAT
jgi:hypothetical protein